MDKTRAWDTLSRLAFNRVSATEDELKAAHLIEEEVKKMGVDVVLEPFTVPNPTVHEVKLEMTKPYTKEFYCTGQGMSGNTPDEGVCGPLVYIHGGQDEYIKDVAGKIVLSTGGMNSELRKKLVAKGAIGYIVTWGGIFDDEIMKTQVPHRWARKTADDDTDFPGVMMNLGTAEELLKEHPEEVRLVLKQDPTTTANTQNVVATIEGTDKKDEVVVFTAHYDSVEFSSGAWDNGTGSITILELCHYYHEHQPRRTVKFIWCGCEEIGLRGSWAYCEAHKDELDKIIFDINFDMTGVILGEDTAFGSVDPKILDQVFMKAKMCGKYLGRGFMGHMLGLPSTDSASFAMHGVPAITFGSHAVRDGATIHSRRDTMDHIHAESFMELLEFVAAWSQDIVNAEFNVIPRKLPEEVTKDTAMMKARLGL